MSGNIKEENGKLLIPTFDSSLPEIHNLFLNQSKLALLLIDISQLYEIEKCYGKYVYGNILEILESIILDLPKKDYIQHDDIMALSYLGGDQYYLFLKISKSRKLDSLDNIEELTKKIQYWINQQIMDLTNPFFKIQPMIRMGYALSFFNPTIHMKRLIQNLILQARKMVELLNLKIEMQQKKDVYDLIREKKIRTLYQPIVNVYTQEVIGYEALSRGIQDSIYENPGLLFDQAKELGLLFELDWICKTNALTAAKDLEPGKKIFIHIFSSSIHNSATRVKYLKKLLEDLQIYSYNVVFEISEKQALENFDVIQDIKRLHKNISFSVKVNDTWASTNIALLKNLPVQYIKIGISLVRNLEKHNLHQELIKTILETGRRIGADIIAEGIQNKKELSLLSDMGITLGQGFLFAKPDKAFPDVNMTEIYMDDEKLRNKLMASIYFKRAKDYYDKGMFDESILEFSKTLELDKNNLEALNLKAKALYEDGGCVAAVKDIDQLLNLNPNYVKAYLTQGLCFERMKRNKEAIKSYKYFIQMAPVFYQSDIELAQQHLEKLIEESD